MTLSQIATINAGYPFRGAIAEKATSAILAVQMRDTSESGGIHWHTCTATTPTGKREPQWLQEGDILIAARGNRYYAVLVKDIPPNTVALAAPQFYVVRTLAKALLPEFLMWQLNQPPCQRYLDKNSEGTSSKSIRASVLADLPIIVPSLEKQRTILALNALILKERKAAQALIHNGEQMLASIANDLFTQA
ncbi:restriction endonuclease subunit S [Paraneptunicella aestuarii]|uniref:restriction endonuclease subunit S n=1 Tax=Paraneptunicella aestuarii TaxID=2831148 RepID=UPI001E50636A|nr:restriction endonuclease subunit S [Paraneptunicella aestuarii]UAA38574.1 restriction endonuclease subunit S [Paraneptunicella aestuarii]